MAGNKNSGGNGKTAKKGAELVQRTRAILLRALDIIEDRAKHGRSKSIAELVADSIQEEPLRFFDKAYKVMPRDINLHDGAGEAFREAMAIFWQQRREKDHKPTSTAEQPSSE